MRFKFKEENPFDKRLADSQKIKQKYAERVPVIVEKNPNSHIPDIDKHKFLVPTDITVAQFMWIIRKRINLDSSKALYIYFGKTIPQSSLTVGSLYDQLKDEDGFLYASFSGESSFGWHQVNVCPLSLPHHPALLSLPFPFRDQQQHHSMHS